ncbi:hypothetical protein MH138_05165 [Bacillus safensis]|uniref:hypothetical protein n=1 Tax=Bacillus TaxID=1386 RepID=UPI0016432597|nr:MULTISPECIES: hypothetical protein [Bacillus]MCY7585496.1 hypothetical protein [Bacillus safensis]MCY7586931.1 hypothetical protein [Bacillus safensis]
MKKEKPKKRPQELTEREIRELMGQNHAKTEKSQRRGVQAQIKGGDIDDRSNDCLAG